MNHKEEGPIWLVKIGSQVYGPMTWDDVIIMRQNKDLSDDDLMKSTTDSRWYPVEDFFPGIDLQKETDDFEGIMPKLSDAIFLLGLLGFFVGVGLFFLNRYLGDVVLILSLAVEVWGIYYSKKNEPEAVAKTIGNIFAILWVIFQGLITVFFVLVTFI